MLLKTISSKESFLGKERGNAAFGKLDLPLNSDIFRQIFDIDGNIGFLRTIETSTFEYPNLNLFLTRKVYFDFIFPTNLLYNEQA